MVKYCVDTLAIPDTAKVVTRGFSLRFADEATARVFQDGFQYHEAFMVLSTKLMAPDRAFRRISPNSSIRW
eukprot:6140550-Amphidinium_carterae.1